MGKQDERTNERTDSLLELAGFYPPAKNQMWHQNWSTTDQHIWGSGNKPGPSQWISNRVQGLMIGVYLVTFFFIFIHEQCL